MAAARALSVTGQPMRQTDRRMTSAHCAVRRAIEVAT
jgi:hypothetical protein